MEHGGGNSALSGVPAMRLYVGEAPEPGPMIIWTENVDAVAQALQHTLREAREYQPAGVFVAPTHTATFIDTLTRPQMQILLSGVTVGGKRIEEAEQILALSEAMELMVSMVRGGSFTLTEHENLLTSLAVLQDPRAQALVYLSSVTRSQFYFDGNKRTARIMMTGALMRAGFEPINISSARKEQLNVALDGAFHDRRCHAPHELPDHVQPH